MDLLLNRFPVNSMENLKVTSPEDKSYKNDKETLEAVIRLFEAEFKKESDDEEHYHIIIPGEYSKILLSQVEEIYKEAGWKIANCSTSSSKGERPGLTGLQLYRYQF